MKYLVYVTGLFHSSILGYCDTKEQADAFIEARKVADREDPDEECAYYTEKVKCLNEISGGKR